MSDIYLKDKITLFSSDDDSDSDTESYNIKHVDYGISEIPWVEKYRPENLDGIIEHTEIISILKKAITTGKLQHLLLYGPPGTGKTSTIHAVTNELFGPKVIRDRVIELNASDDRGIGTVRNKIISFAKTSIGSCDPNYPCPDFKIVILDEADTMTEEAQAALRKVIEKMSKITRFCFICNYVDRIIEPIASRCMKLKFKPIRNEFIFDKLKHIAKNENLNVSDDCLEAIIEISEGDARRSIMNLQNLQYLIKYKKNITKNDIIQMNGNIDKDKFSNFWKICSSGTIKQIKDLASNLCREGYVIKSIIKHLMNCLMESDVDEKIKSIILIELCNTDRKLSEGCTESLQLLNIMLYTNCAINKKK
jgi:replication factor C subunit 2/4